MEGARRNATRTEDWTADLRGLRLRVPKEGLMNMPGSAVFCSFLRFSAVLGAMG